ncbi:hypothetical protein VTI74DRAFT_5781 [Chaetomium olivicolor]
MPPTADPWCNLPSVDPTVGLLIWSLANGRIAAKSIEPEPVVVVMMMPIRSEKGFLGEMATSKREERAREKQVEHDFFSCLCYRDMAGRLTRSLPNAATA